MSVPVTPAVLRWARESQGLTIKEVVIKLKRKRVTEQIIDEWENGKECPTYSQLERLAYEIYKRPLAVFFFPEPPAEETPEESFRTLPSQEIDNLPPRIRYLLRKARALQLNLSELFDGINPVSKNILSELTLGVREGEKSIAKKVREFIGVDLEDQINCRDSKDALAFWRTKLEEVGIFIFKDAFREKDFSGFCIYDEIYPIIYVNNSTVATRQIFTLFHELAHLLYETGGIDTRRNEYIKHLSGQARQIEIMCNKFAGEFLVPSADFRRRLPSDPADDECIARLASTYKVSREVVLRKLLDMGIVDQATYDEKVYRWSKEMPTTKKSGGNPYRTQGVYLGMKYMERAFSKYYRNQIDIGQLADYLGVKEHNVSGMEALLSRRG